MKIATLLVLAACISSAQNTDWAYGGGHDQIRYSPLKQINRSNASKLEKAWSFETGGAFEGSEMQCNPLVIKGVLYATTPGVQVIALDGATGKLKWRFDPHEGREYKTKSRTRGLIYWSDGTTARIYVAMRNHLYAIDAATGERVREFGQDGRIDLREGLGRDLNSINLSVTTPGAVYKDMLILGGITSEDLPAAPGDVRAFDARTGKVRWSFHTIPHPGEFGYDTWPEDAWKRSGGANSWAGMALDEKRGLVFVPTGSAAFDFYGADRHGDNLFANSLIALDANTGKRVWHFQFIKHDVWDRDLPTPPSLVTLKQNGRTVDAVVQATKSGHIFVFERETGKPVFPIEYVKAPPSDVEGERLAATQPIPVKPPPIARQIVTEDMVRTEAGRERFRKLRSGPQFTPPSLAGTIVFPGFDGGAEWGGQAFDPQTGLYYVNSNEMAWVLRLVERKQTGVRATGKTLYESNCANCHRRDLKGSPPEFPSLVDLGSRRSTADIMGVIRKGAGRMPVFPALTDAAVDAITKYITAGEDKEVIQPAATQTQALKYTHDGYNKFLEADGLPAITPPWGTLNAVNLNKGEIAWSIPLGEVPKSGIKNSGSENYGGPVVTAGGVLFIGATTHDRKFRVFDKRNGKLLWETTLPAAGNATPAVYEVNGRQFVVIAAGGGKWGNPSGDSYVAFALPAK